MKISDACEYIVDLQQQFLSSFYQANSFNWQFLIGFIHDSRQWVMHATISLLYNC